MVRNYLMWSLLLVALTATSGCQSAARQETTYSPVDYGGSVSAGASSGRGPSCH